jgi:hypothetical protein
MLGRSKRPRSHCRATQVSVQRLGAAAQRCKS